MPVDDVTLVTPEQSVEVLALNEALDQLAEVDEQQSRIVELRYFGGLSEEETAQVLGISSKTVQRGLEDCQGVAVWTFNQFCRERIGVKMKAVDRNLELVRPDREKANLISVGIGIVVGFAAYSLTSRSFLR